MCPALLSLVSYIGWWVDVGPTAAIARVQLHAVRDGPVPSDEDPGWHASHRVRREAPGSFATRRDGSIGGSIARVTLKAADQVVGTSISTWWQCACRILRGIWQKNQPKDHLFTIFFCFFLENYIILTATAVLYLRSSLTGAQRSHLGQRQFSIIISLLQLRKFIVTC